MSPDHLDGSHVRTYISLYLQLLCTEYICRYCTYDTVHTSDCNKLSPYVQYIHTWSTEYGVQYILNLALHNYRQSRHPNNYNRFGIWNN